MSQFRGCILQRMYLRTNCVRAAWIGCPIVKAPNAPSKCVLLSQRHNGPNGWTNLSQDSLCFDAKLPSDEMSNAEYHSTEQLMVHTAQKTRGNKSFSSCPTAALLLGNSNKDKISWWHWSRKSSLDQTVSFPSFGPRRPPPLCAGRLRELGHS